MEKADLYLYHTHHWRAAASYVALTRQRESAQVFVARETARDAAQLARQMAHEEIKASSVAWATADELTPAQRVRAQHDGTAAQASQNATNATVESRPATKASYWQTVVARSPTADPIPPLAPSAGEKERVPTEILIPAYVDPAGRDSLGRGLDPASIAVAVAKDHAVQQERDALPHYLRGAYRDPHAVQARLGEMVQRQGWTSTVARVAQDPTLLGELRGRVGLLAGTRARIERAMAERAAAAVAASLERIAAAQARAAQAYRGSVEAQRQADATPIPKLSVRAEAAVVALAAAPDEKVRAELWGSITADTSIDAELRRFSAAVQQRFGDETVRAMLRAEGRAVEATSVPRQHQAALAAVSRTVHSLKQGEWAGAQQAQSERLTQRQLLGYRPGMRL
jgi:BID domain of Bartonella effector protein (Bep)